MKAIDVGESVVDVNVDRDYVIVKTVKGHVYAFYRPSFMGLHVRSYLSVAISLIISAILIFGGLNLLGESLCNKYGYLCFALSFIAFVTLVSGIVLLFIKERVLLIESHGGLRIRFRKPRISERQLIEIIENMSKETLTINRSR